MYVCVWFKSPNLASTILDIILQHGTSYSVMMLEHNHVELTGLISAWCNDSSYFMMYIKIDILYCELTQVYN